jgi:hypothetical protein
MRLLPICVYLCFPPSNLKVVDRFHKTWHERCAIIGHPDVILRLISYIQLNRQDRSMNLRSERDI